MKPTGAHDILKCSALPPSADPELPLIHAIQKLASHNPAGLPQSAQSSQEITNLFCYSPIPWPPSDLEVHVNHWHFNVIFFANALPPSDIWI